MASFSVRQVLLIEGAANAVVLIAKAAVGVATGSAAILGDALHSLSDLANNGFSLVAHRMSTEPPDPEHPYGHHKFEQLAVFVLATLLSVSAFQLVLQAVRQAGEPVDTSAWGLAVMIAVLFVNIGVSAWEAHWARKLDSDLLHADVRHTLSDVVVTIGVIIGWQVAAYRYAWVDPLVAVVVACIIFYFAYGLFRRAIPVLVDQAATDPLTLRRTVESVPEVREVRRARSRAGGGGPSADVVIVVDAELSTTRAHEVSDAVERALANELNIEDVTVHVEPSEK